MSRYMQQVETLVPMDVDPEDLVTLAEAARMLEVTVQAVAGAVDGGSYAVVIIDTSVPMKRGYKGRRLLLRDEVMGKIVQRVYA